MSVVLDEPALKQAYEGSPELEGAIRNAAAAGPHYIELFNYISLHINKIKAARPPPPSSESSEPASKKRKIDENGLASRPATNGSANGHAAIAAPIASAEDEVLLEVKDISMVSPQRKKFTLCFTQEHIYARLPESKEPVAGTSLAWRDIEYAFLLPVPEKTQKQHNILLFPQSSSLPPTKPTPGTSPPPEPLVFTIPDTAPKSGTISGSLSSTAAAVSDDFKTLMTWALTTRLKSVGNKKVTKLIESDVRLFSSELRQAHRPGEKATWVKSFRGSKDGYLFFLPNGILWAFKKPLLFLPFERIGGVSYTSVLQRTFNLSIEVDVSGNSHVKQEADEDDNPAADTQEELEFSMIDQEDFSGIDAFIKRHGLADTSLAEKRRAKRENVNVVRDEHGNVVGSEEAGELKRAGMEMAGGDDDDDGGAGGMGLADEDDEDSEGEDYDPGSEGESEGSGSSSSEEEEDGEGDGGGGDEDEEEDEDGDGDGEGDEL